MGVANAERGTMVMAVAAGMLIGGTLVGLFPVLVGRNRELRVPVQADGLVIDQS